MSPDGGGAPRATAKANGARAHRSRPVTTDLRVPRPPATRRHPKRHVSRPVRLRRIRARRDGAVDLVRARLGNRLLRWVVGTVVAAALGGYAWWATGFLPFSWPDRLAVGVPAIVVLCVAAIRSRRSRTTLRRWAHDLRAEMRRHAPTKVRLGIAGWVVILGTLTIWELVEFFQSPRAAHPTLSSMTEALLAYHPIRAAVFVLWVALGVDFLRR